MYTQTLAEYIWRLRQTIVVNSIAYYELNETIMSDDGYDLIVKKYMKIEIPVDYRDDLDYIFYDFDGSTGYHLFKRLTTEHQHKYLNKAQYLIKINNK